MLYAVLETLHNHTQLWSLGWLVIYNILKVSIKSVEPGIRAIIDSDHDWLAFFSKNLCSYYDGYFSVNNLASWNPGFEQKLI